MVGRGCGPHAGPAAALSNSEIVFKIYLRVINQNRFAGISELPHALKYFNVLRLVPLRNTAAVQRHLLRRRQEPFRDLIHTTTLTFHGLECGRGSIPSRLGGVGVDRHFPLGLAVLHVTAC